METNGYQISGDPTPEEFVRAWQLSRSLDEVVRRTGMRATRASYRASQYRNKGVNLKKFRGAPPEKIDVRRLQEIVKELSR